MSKFKAKFVRKGITDETITVKFELNLMSSSSVQACAKLALGDKCNVNHTDYCLESVTEL